MSYKPLTDEDIARIRPREYRDDITMHVTDGYTLIEQARRANRLAEAVEEMKRDGTSPTFRELFDALASYRGDS